MKIDGLKVADVDCQNDKATAFGICSEGVLSGEGQRILKEYPDYKILKNDWAVKTENDFYASVVYAYMVDQILAQNQGNDSLMEKYAQATESDSCRNPNNPTEKSYKKMNCEFLSLYDAFSGGCVECPYCHSNNTKKLKASSRITSFLLVGAASGKIGKQWHCNHCGSDF